MTEAPQNGLKGLKHWRYDLLAGMQVALVSLPLSLGIAIASGAPPVTGLVSAIIAGLIFPFLGGAYVTISGPAAGLAPALLSGMLVLGGGDLAVGYPLLLVAICLTGLVQIVLAFMNAGRFAIFLPVTVVEAMLAAIGLIIIIKQIPALIGADVPAAKSMLATASKLPGAFLQIQWQVFAIGIITLFLIFYLNKSKYTWMRKVPAPLVVTILGIIMASAFGLDAKYLITMPENILEGGITLPDFSGVFSNPDLYWSILVVVITLTLIDGVESLATIKAVDKIDPFQRKSDPNVTLRAMGVSNTASSLFGGLTIIPGGIKSRTNIDAGGRTLWANFYNAIFLLIFLFIATDIISLVPLAAIASILIYVGWKLCEYKVFTKTYSIGRDQMIVFIITVIAVLATDLLIGILIGIAAEIIILLYLLTPSFRFILNGRLTATQSLVFLWKNFKTLFADPVIKYEKSERDGKVHHELSLSSVVCFNLLPLDKILDNLPNNEGVTLTITESSHIIDHTGMEYLHQFQEECVRDKRPCEVLGLENFHQFTKHPLSARMQDAILVKEEARRTTRELAMEKIAAQQGLTFNAEITNTLNKEDFIYLRRGSDKEESNVMQGEYDGCKVRLFDYSHTSAPNYYSKHWRTLVTANCVMANVPDFVIAPGHYLERYLTGYNSKVLIGKTDSSSEYRLYTSDNVDASTYVSDELQSFLMQHPQFYIEMRDGVILAYNCSEELADTEQVALLLSVAGIVQRSCASREG
ncbi:MAG: SulP family inorganic anion transporter [Gammaproteobacteria bacterium]|nr:SulP family inorganic anion transporter [Gammaproteobacteria bacterium]